MSVAIDLQDDLASNQAKEDEREEIELGWYSGKEARDCPASCPWDHEKSGPTGNKLSTRKDVEEEAQTNEADNTDYLVEQWPYERTCYWCTLDERKRYETNGR